MEVQKLLSQINTYVKSRQKPAGPATPGVRITENKAGGERPKATEEVSDEPEVQIDTAQREQITEKINEFLKKNDMSLHHYVHEGTKQMAVKIINNETKEIVREVPPEALLDLAAKIDEMFGLFFDEHV